MVTRTTRWSARARHSGFLLLAGLLSSTAAHAKPQGPKIFCAVYPTSPVCAGRIAGCPTCHTLPPPGLNAYGLEISAQLGPDYEADLPAALAAVETLDADGDGVDNLHELAQGTAPGDAISAQPPSGEARPYDESFTLRRLTVAFCGQSATYEELTALRSTDDKKRVLHDKLTACLANDYWRREAVPHLADRRIEPVLSMGTCFLPLVDFEKDYDLFTYAMTEGRDARLLLTAQFHVTREEDGGLTLVDESAGPAQPPATRAGVTCTLSLPLPGAPSGALGAQNVAPPYRAGMWTTANFIVMQTQDTFLPRVTAAQAYRHWLGFELSGYEGIFDVTGEPRDIDQKNVDQAPCSYCHSTLDPLAYAFAYYPGVPNQRGGVSLGLGSYDRERIAGITGIDASITAAWLASPPTPRLFGEPFPLEDQTGAESSLVLIARAAAESDAFARNLTLMVFRHAIGGDPEPRDLGEFDQLWRSLKANGYSIDALLHTLVDTAAFGAP
jgi:Protein of unknown function (DUF1585)